MFNSQRTIDPPPKIPGGKLTTPKNSRNSTTSKVNKISAKSIGLNKIPHLNQR